MSAINDKLAKLEEVTKEQGNKITAALEKSTPNSSMPIVFDDERQNCYNQTKRKCIKFLLKNLVYLKGYTIKFC